MLSMTALQHVLFLQLLVILVYFYEMDWFCLADFLWILLNYFSWTVGKSPIVL